MIEIRKQTLGLCAAMAMCSGGAQATVYTSYTDAQVYSWRVTNMPDFDQRRSMCSGIPGLPFNGAMYSAPAATLNIAAYVANHGYPSVAPGVGIWATSLPATYNAATQNMLLLGEQMSTDPTSGTDIAGWIAGSKAWFNPLLFSVSLQVRTTSYSPRIHDIASAGFSGALVAFSYGRYTHNADTLLQRLDGHAVTATSVNRTNNSFGMNFRDPADENFPNCTQSAWVNKGYNVRNVTVTFAGNPISMSEVLIYPLDGRRRFIDTMLVVRPRFGLLNSAPNVLTTIAPATFQPGGGGPATKSTTSPFGPIIDFASMPDLSATVVLTQLNASSPHRLWVHDPLGDQWTSIGDIVSARGLAVGRHREVYVGVPGAVRVYDLDATPPSPVPIPYPNSAAPDVIVYDDEADQVSILDKVGGRILLYSRNMTEFIREDQIVPAVQFGNFPSLAIACDGSVLVASELFDGVHRFTRNRFTGGSLVFEETITHPSLIAPRNLVSDEECRLIFTSNGVVRELVKVGGVWQPEPNSLFAGMAAAGRFIPSRSRSNFDPQLHSGPDWSNIHPDEITDTGFVQPCPGDVNADGAVDFDDLAILLADFGQQASWLSADLNQDGVVDFDDLGELLTNFGVECETQPGQP